ncbi:MAG TPA: sarcosine oxidase subunit delta, partial [Thalassospira lucentensis]
KGPHFERWRHAHGCGRFFNAVRDTVSDRFLTTYKADATRPDLAVLLADASMKEPSK